MEYYYNGKNYLIIEGIDPITKGRFEIYTIYLVEGDRLKYINYFYFGGDGLNGLNNNDIEELKETCRHYINNNN